MSSARTRSMWPVHKRPAAATTASCSGTVPDPLQTGSEGDLRERLHALFVTCPFAVRRCSPVLSCVSSRSLPWRRAPMPTRAAWSRSGSSTAAAAPKTCSRVWRLRPRVACTWSVPRSTPTTTSWRLLRFGGQRRWLRTYDGPGDGNDYGSAAATDGHGDLFVAGYVTQPDDSIALAVVKYDSAGHLRWARADGAPAAVVDLPVSLAVDRAGAVYLAGTEIDLNTSRGRFCRHQVLGLGDPQVDSSVRSAVRRSPARHGGGRRR